jgi:hypothetical protein
MRPAAHPQMELTDNHGGTGLRGDGAINISGGAQFLNTQPREFFAHGDDHDFGVHACSFGMLIHCKWNCDQRRGAFIGCAISVIVRPPPFRPSLLRLEQTSGRYIGWQ